MDIKPFWEDQNTASVPSFWRNFATKHKKVKVNLLNFPRGGLGIYDLAKGVAPSPFQMIDKKS